MIQNKFILHDASSKVIFTLPENKEIGQFLQHNVLDSRLTVISELQWKDAISQYSLETDIEDKIIYHGGFCWIDKTIIFNECLLTTENKNKRLNIKFLSKGYEFINSIIDSHTSLVASSGYFITLDDIRLFPDITELANSLADAWDISITEATTQLLIEKESLLNIEKYRKKSIWTHTKTLLKITSEPDYKLWQHQVKARASGLGLI